MEKALILTSPAFGNGELIPSKYTCDESPPAGGMNPPLVISGVGDGVQSLVLIMDDPDVPKAVRDNQMFDHWVLFNIVPTTTHIGEGEGPGILGSNTMGEAAYIGPCPPTQFEPKEHRYIFQLYALDTMLDIREGASKEVVKSAMKGHILQKTELMGKYSRIRSE